MHKQRIGPWRAASDAAAFEEKTVHSHGSGRIVAVDGSRPHNHFGEVSCCATVETSPLFHNSSTRDALMLDPDTNLILRWLRTLPNHRRAALAAQFTLRLVIDGESSPVANRYDDPGRALGELLYVNCADSLGLSPTELRGLIVAPQRYVMQSITWLALEQIRNMRSGHQNIEAELNSEVTWYELPPRIARRMNDVPF